mmetsp:Transcript_22202/g.32773  ORF Transcript_22202/g.32773 Transcript_22202/m.32773 type:complete len:274 (-) Transcript_22202:1011-1832(-)|eukprot:CAMPEP_0194247756 /NCGR_PEP_ID=MMETSP0158-20130606/17071_1 /TAXON_ID=33649 /ORGANISM="Thalassionema nitzschioides, Strain L26-B" /LENGTH=273 /DNA_ID=CAMNT_0038983901 /DNA_START=115 /DNA_END=936 /DNA_ORIENTATION=+
MDPDRKLPATRRRNGNKLDESKDNVSSMLHPFLRYPGSAEVIEIMVKRPCRSEIPSLEISIAGNATVLELKTVIREELADESPCLMVPVERQRLLFAGKMLSNNDSRLVEDIGMRKDTINYIHLAPIPKGNIPTKRTSLENKFRSRSRSRKNRYNHRYRPYSLPTAAFTRQRSTINPYLDSHIAGLGDFTCSTNINRREAAELSPLSPFSSPITDINSLIPLHRMTHLTQPTNNESVSPESPLLMSEQTMRLLQSLSACDSDMTRSLRFGPCE